MRQDACLRQRQTGKRCGNDVIDARVEKGFHCCGELELFGPFPHSLGKPGLFDCVNNLAIKTFGW